MLRVILSSSREVRKERAREGLPLKEWKTREEERSGFVHDASNENLHPCSELTTHANPQRSKNCPQGIRQQKSARMVERGED